MPNLNRLYTFIAIVDAGSLTGAAHVLGITKAMVSLNLKQLEAELGVSLLARTTRRLALTEVGERFYHDCVRVLADADAAIQQARIGQSALTGSLRVTSTAEYGTRFVVPALADFGRQHPALQIEYSTSQQPADLIAERFDIAIRLGTMRDSSLRAAPIQRFNTLAVATPVYLQTRRLPRTPQDLDVLDWIEHARFTAPLTWTSVRAKKTVQTPHWKGSFKADTAIAVLTLVKADCGAAILPDWLVEEDLNAGRLTRILKSYTLPEQGVFAVFPDTPHVTAKVRHFIDFMQGYVRRGK
jgi:DNA-binding transcriptional LysR family regulator